MQLVLKLILFFFLFQTTRFLVCKAVECKTSTDPSKVAYTVTVSQSGAANFTTVADALKSVPPRSDKWIKISVSPGTYKEQIQVDADKTCIVLEGSDRSTTTISFNAHDTTADSPTFNANANSFVARGITFVNSYNVPKDNPNPKVPAVAIRVSGDKQAFFNCGFVGYQDTLWDYEGRHYFKDCYIEGAVDFIWGSGQSVYENCAINVTDGGYITAQGRESAKDTNGFVLRGCDISGPGHACLGRAYRAFSRVIYIESKFSSVVDPEGWSVWNQQGHEGDITYAEVNCTGPGSDVSKRVTWMKTLDSSELEQYSTSAFIDQEGWIAKLP